MKKLLQKLLYWYRLIILRNKIMIGVDFASDRNDKSTIVFMRRDRKGNLFITDFYFEDSKF